MDTENTYDATRRFLLTEARDARRIIRQTRDLRTLAQFAEFLEVVQSAMVTTRKVRAIERKLVEA